MPGPVHRCTNQPRSLLASACTIGSDPALTAHKQQLSCTIALRGSSLSPLANMLLPIRSARQHEHKWLASWEHRGMHSELLTCHLATSRLMGAGTLQEELPRLRRGLLPCSAAPAGPPALPGCHQGCCAEPDAGSHAPRLPGCATCRSCCRPGGVQGVPRLGPQPGRPERCEEPSHASCRLAFPQLTRCCLQYLVSVNTWCGLGTCSLLRAYLCASGCASGLQAAADELPGAQAARAGRPHELCISWPQSC